MVTSVLNTPETWFWYLSLCFWVMGIIWDNFHEPQINLNLKSRVDGLSEAEDNFKEWIVTLVLNMLETFLCTSLYYFRFQGKNLASDQHEDQCASQVNESLQFSESPDEITSMIKQTYTLYWYSDITSIPWVFWKCIVPKYSTLQIWVLVDHWRRKV